MNLAHRLLSLLLLAAFLFPEALHAAGDSCARGASTPSAMTAAARATDGAPAPRGSCDHPGGAPAGAGRQACAAAGLCMAIPGL
ncbi:MAG TPA: hypothetical protein VHR43_05380, partial [Gemmatimonadales bacterium]|nr:hypothetical protein [Gemmatimonadales bacterium]